MMLARLLLVLSLALAPALARADAHTIRDRIITELSEDGYTEVRIGRTLLGRTRFVATRPDARREIVVNPRTGVILRDYIRFLSTSSRSDDDVETKYSDDSDHDDDDESDDDESDDSSDDDGGDDADDS